MTKDIEISNLLRNNFSQKKQSLVSKNEKTNLFWQGRVHENQNIHRNKCTKTKHVKIILNEMLKTKKMFFLLNLWTN